MDRDGLVFTQIEVFCYDDGHAGSRVVLFYKPLTSFFTRFRVHSLSSVLHIALQAVFGGITQPHNVVYHTVLNELPNSFIIKHENPATD